MSTYNFNNKRVWITGASSGIGLALAKRLLNENARVAVTARNQTSLEEIYSPFEKALVVPGDITDLSVNQSIIAKIKKQWSGLDCVILNAGSAEYIDIKNFCYQPFANMMTTNFLSIVKGVEASLPVLRQSESPYLIAMSSSVAWQGLPQGQAYSASKAAIRNLFQGLKIQLSKENIDVSWICPGFVKTPLTDKNQFSMPSRISAEESAEIIYQKLTKKTTEIHFPKRFTYLLKLISILPAGWGSKLLKGTVPEQ